MQFGKRTGALCAFSAASVASQYLRNFVAVISTQLTAALHLTSTDFGWFSATFFLTFAAAQVPLGLAFDRVGVRWPTAVLMLVGAASLIGFSAAPDKWSALVAMAGIGLSCAPIFTGLMVYASHTFEQRGRLRVLTVVSAIGVTGSLIAGTPLGLAAATIGWRASLACSSVLPALVIVVTVEDEPSVSEAPAPASGPISAKKFSHALLPIIPACLAMGAGGALRSSWAGPYLATAFGADSQAIGNAMTAVSVVAIAFGFLVPVLLTRLSAAMLCSIAWSLGSLAALILALCPSGSGIEGVTGLSVLVALGGLYPIVVDQARELFPPDKTGLALSSASMLAFLSVSVLSLVFGAIGGFTQRIHPGNMAGFAAMFVLSALVCVAALIAGCRKPRG